MLSVPKRLRYFMRRGGAALNMVLRIFLRVIAQTLQTPCGQNIKNACLCRVMDQLATTGSGRSDRVDHVLRLPTLG